jgi:hypothetical protein
MEHRSSHSLGRSQTTSFFSRPVADGHALIAAHAQLAGRCDQFVSTGMARLARGTATGAMEMPDNSDSRNICFELGTAAWLVSCGLILNASDTADIAGHISEYYLLMSMQDLMNFSLPQADPAI